MRVSWVTKALETYDEAKRRLDEHHRRLTREAAECLRMWREIKKRRATVKDP